MRYKYEPWKRCGYTPDFLVYKKDFMFHEYGVIPTKTLIIEVKPTIEHVDFDWLGRCAKALNRRIAVLIGEPPDHRVFLPGEYDPSVYEAEFVLRNGRRAGYGPYFGETGPISMDWPNVAGNNLSIPDY